MTFTELLGYNNQMFNNILKLVKNNVPIILVAGDADTVVPYVENGKMLHDAYVESGCIFRTII